MNCSIVSACAAILVLLTAGQVMAAQSLARFHRVRAVVLTGFTALPGAALFALRAPGFTP